MHGTAEVIPSPFLQLLVLSYLRDEYDSRYNNEAASVYKYTGTPYEQTVIMS